MNGSLALQINGTQNFMGQIIPVVLGGFGADKKCVSDKTIAEIHNMLVKNVRARITDNLKRFKENVDFIDLKQRAYDTDTLELLQKLGYAKQSITQAEHIYLLSERGYVKLVKIMDTDLAWEVHDNLIDTYFQLRADNRTDLVTRSEMMDFLHNLYDSQQQFFSSFNKSMQLLSQVLLNTTKESEESLPLQTPNKNLIVEQFLKEVNDLCKDIIAHSVFLSNNQVLSYAYSRITQKYGIVWDQEKKDYCTNQEYSYRSVLDMIANSDEQKYLKSILLAVLRDMNESYANSDVSLPETPCTELQLASTWEEAQQYTLNLARYFKDNSPNAANTYKKIYGLMDNGINWRYYCSSYKKANGIHDRKMQPTKKTMIGNNLHLQKLFIKALNNKISETERN